MRGHLLACLVLCGIVAARAGDTRAGEARSHADEVRHFDGVWTTTLSCTNSNGALGYSFQFTSIVKDGVLHGEKGDKGQPGWLQVDGEIRPDGTANLYVQGLVGAAPFAVGRRPAGTSYGYHLDSRFSDAAGEGTRVEGRPCNAVFMKVAHP